MGDPPSSDLPPASPTMEEEQSSPEDQVMDEEPMLDEVDVRELLRGALQPPAEVPRDMLRGVQRRIRHRSRGKFYADGWSTTRSPRSVYLTTSILMLVLIAFVLLVLIPWGGGALP
ncbi:Hypothetical protein CAP_2146 [Chondromyces apiculatus DSM 436]|uniref:Uncharacterized protein n=2 Tax=Chondromyces apiculatus TaxID=51 RepID=A0A017TAF3_9BACT|nr:Hypothetical protein CAP_2146 [Chondromyces apiculatus DSM 436]